MKIAIILLGLLAFLGGLSAAIHSAFAGGQELFLILPTLAVAVLGVYAIFNELRFSK